MTGSIVMPDDDTLGIYPKTDNYGFIGSSNYKFYNMFTNKMTANLY
jgi:hypothetical protein